MRKYLLFIYPPACKYSWICCRNMNALWGRALGSAGVLYNTRCMVCTALLKFKNIWFLKHILTLGFQVRTWGPADRQPWVAGTVHCLCVKIDEGPHLYWLGLWWLRFQFSREVRHLSDFWAANFLKTQRERKFFWRKAAPFSHTESKLYWVDIGHGFPRENQDGPWFLTATDTTLVFWAWSLTQTNSTPAI